MKITIPKIVAQVITGTAIALSVVSLFGMLAGTAHADINNPHSTPPNNSITNPMLKTGIVYDPNVNDGAGIQLFKIGTTTDSGKVLFGGVSNVATDTAFSYDSTNHVLRTTGLITAQASTTINNVAYQFPAAHGAANTSLTDNGSGTLSWSKTTATAILRSATNGGSSNSNNASTTVFTYAMPAATLGINDTLRIHAVGFDDGCGSNNQMALWYGDGTSSTTLGYTSPPGGTPITVIDAYVSNQGSGTSQQTNSLAAVTGSAPVFANVTTGFNTTASTTYFALRYFCINGANASMKSFTVEQIPNT